MPSLQVKSPVRNNKFMFLSLPLSLSLPPALSKSINKKKILGEKSILILYERNNNNLMQAHGHGNEERKYSKWIWQSFLLNPCAKMESVGQSNIYHFFPITTHLKVEFSICHFPKDIFTIISMSAIIPTLFITLKQRLIKWK